MRSRCRWKCGVVGLWAEKTQNAARIAPEKYTLEISIFEPYMLQILELRNLFPVSYGIYILLQSDLKPVHQKARM